MYLLIQLEYINLIEELHYTLFLGTYVNFIVNHINSTPRAILDERTPYGVALETLVENVLKAYQLKPIAPDEVNLTTKLIRFNH